MKTIRIGSGAGYAGDRIEPAMELIEKGNLDYIIFECLAERTVAIGQQDKEKDSEKGYNQLLEYRMKKILPLLFHNHVKMITNMGAANPKAAARQTKKIAEELQKQFGIKIDKRHIQVASPIRSVGLIDVPVKIYQDITGIIQIRVNEG